MNKRRWKWLALAALGINALTGAARAASDTPVTRLILLGTEGGPVFRSRAQPANLLVVRGTPYLIDAGNGVARQLALAHVPIATIRQIFITHNHDDHNADWGTVMGLAWSTGNKAPMTVHGPRGTESMLKGFLQYFTPNVDSRYVPQSPALAPAEVMHAKDIQGPGLVYEDANIRVTAVENCHYHFDKGTPSSAQQSFAFRFQTPDRVIVFSGDTGPCGHVIGEFAKDADILVHEVIDLPAFERLLPAGASPQWREGLMNHMRTEHTSPEEIGRTASEAGVKKVVLSHVIPGLPTDKESAYIDGVRKFYSGPVVLGQDLMEF